jgi:hypothetical protein
MKKAWLFVAGFAALIAVSLLFEGPRNLYYHAVLI